MHQACGIVHDARGHPAYSRVRVIKVSRVCTTVLLLFLSLSIALGASIGGRAPLSISAPLRCPRRVGSDFRPRPEHFRLLTSHQQIVMSLINAIQHMPLQLTLSELGGSGAAFHGHHVLEHVSSSLGVLCMPPNRHFQASGG
jgi:hypothetical protein